MKLIDIIDQKFGMLTVNKRLKAKDGKHTIWECVCDCGNITRAYGYELRGGNKISCGCWIKNKYDLTDQKFGKLTVIEKDLYQKNSKRPKWICLCDCGNKCSIYSRNLKRKTTIDCGCGASNRLLKRSINSRTGIQVLKNKIYDSYIANSKKKNLIFSISKSDFERLIEQNCFYCNCRPNTIKIMQYFDKTQISMAYNGLDRLDNTIGYTLENVVSCCKDCNFFKNKRSCQEFLEKISVIYQNRVQFKEGSNN